MDDKSIITNLLLKESLSVPLLLFFPHFPDLFFLFLSLNFLLFLPFDLQQLSSVFLAVDLMEMSFGDLSRIDESELLVITYILVVKLRFQMSSI